MSYTADYIDETGKTREVSITEEDSVEALRNDYQEVIRRYNPKYVSIQRAQAGPGEALHLKLTVHAPSHYLTSSDDKDPKACDSMTADLICYPGYPLRAMTASYPRDHHLASPNVFCSGAACIDKWVPLKSSLTTVVEKLVRDMIHDPCVTNYDSMANRNMEKWHRSGVAAGQFPTIPPKLLYAPEVTPLPPRRAARSTRKAPPPMPARRR